MREKPILIGVVILALVAAFAITRIVIGKSTKTVNSSQKQKREIKPDIPGTIDGKNNPELIPDHIAYALIFNTIAQHQNTDFEKNRSRAWAKSVGFDDTETDKLLDVANEYQKRVSVLDAQAKEIKDRSWPNPTTQVIEGLTDLEKKREAIIAEIVSSLSTQMGNKGKEKLDHHVKHDVKGKMKLFTGPAAPAEKHH